MPSLVNTEWACAKIIDLVCTLYPIYLFHPCKHLVLETWSKILKDKIVVVELENGKFVNRILDSLVIQDPNRDCGLQ